MERAIRLQCFQNLVNYRKPTSFIIKETFPLPPYSTVLGMIHAACGFKEFHPMKLSIQGTNSGTISELYTRYSFNGAKYEEGRHQICVDDGEKYGVFRGIANVELICENHMVIHIIPSFLGLCIVFHIFPFPGGQISVKCSIRPYPFMQTQLQYLSPYHLHNNFPVFLLQAYSKPG